MRALWPHAFALEMPVCVRGDQLDAERAVTNTGAAQFSFAAALHTYLRVAKAEAARLSGLQDCRYEDFARGAFRVDDQTPLRIDDEVDRIYFGTTGPRPPVRRGGPKKNITNR